MKQYSKPVINELGSIAGLTAAMLAGSFADALGMLPNGNTGAMMMAGMMMQDS